MSASKAVNSGNSEQSKKRLRLWAKGCGVIKHNAQTRNQVRGLLARLASKGIHETEALNLLCAADTVANAAMWLVAHMSYAHRVRLDGEALAQEDFKPDPQGHTGGSLNMVPGYVGYMLANALTGITRSWIMGQGHAVAAIDAVNLLLDNMRPEHAARYEVSDAGLSRFVSDFYSYALNEHGHQDSPLGSHVNVNTAGGVLEGGYLGFADIQYVHMPLLGERLVAFLSDGAFEEQRGSDWAPRWWRANDSGLAIPIMIFNGRRIDQRSTMSQGQGLPWFKRHLREYSFEPLAFDGTDPAAFCCMIIEGERLLEERSERLLAGADKYPVRMPYGIAVAQKGAGFYGAGTNDAHGLPLGTNPSRDSTARRHFNAAAKLLFTPVQDLQVACSRLKNHDVSGRIYERDHPLANRDARIERHPRLQYLPLPENRRDPAYRTFSAPMDGIDLAFLAYVKANPSLRPRVGNPDEMRSNRMNATLDYLKHRVTEVEAGVAEAIDGKVITVLNEEAVVCACLGNKSGLNLTVTYEAFAPKMLGALRQEVIWSDHLLSREREPGWISVPLVLTSHTFENGKNERSHQDPAMCEAMLGEPSDVSRVLFPADYNSAMACVDACYRTRGRIFTLVAPKAETLPVLFDEAQAGRLVAEGAMRLDWLGKAIAQHSTVILTAIGAYQLGEVLRAAERLEDRGIVTAVNYMIEPGRFRDPRGRREAAGQIQASQREQLYPEQTPHRVFACHTRPEVIAGVLRPLDSGLRTVFLGYANHGGTLSTAGMLFINRLSWAHIMRATARSLGMELTQVLDRDEIDALEGRRSPHGVIV